MSISQKVKYTCTNCGANLSTTIWNSVNTNMRESLPGEIVSGTFFKIKCPYCGDVADRCYSMLYHDISRCSLIWLLHPDEENYNELLGEIRSSDVPSECTSRLVSSVDQLREKISALEAGRDDRVIELYKTEFSSFVFQKHPELIGTDAIYLYINGKENILFVAEDGTNRSFVFQEDFYDSINRKYAVQLSALPDCAFPQYDNAWAGAVVNEQSAVMQNSTGDIAQPLPHVLYCHKCGSAIIQGSNFCSACGTVLPSAIAVQQPAAVGASRQAVGQTYAPTVQPMGNINTAYQVPVRNMGKKKRSPVRSILLAVLGLFAAIFALNVIDLCVNNYAEESANEQITQTELEPVFVSNGKFFEYPGDECLAPLSIETSGTKDYYIFLDDMSGSYNDMAFYVMGGYSFETTVPLDRYQIYYAVGDTWYGKNHLFGPETEYYKCDGTFTFYSDGDYYQGYTLELYPQYNGNLDTDSIDASAFPG